MLESIQERQALLRAEIHDEYYNLSPTERAKVDYEEYMERELAEREGDKYWKWLGIAAGIVLVLFLIFSPR